MHHESFLTPGTEEERLNTLQTCYWLALNRNMIRTVKNVSVLLFPMLKSVAKFICVMQRTCSSGHLFMRVPCDVMQMETANCAQNFIPNPALRDLREAKVLDTNVNSDNSHCVWCFAEALKRALLHASTACLLCNVIEAQAR